MEATIEFQLPIEKWTLERAKNLLESLDIDGFYTIGGDDGTIQYDIWGGVYIYEIKDEHVPTMLKKIINAGLWPSEIGTSECSLGKDDFIVQYNRFGGKLDKFWDWMKTWGDEE